MEYIVQQNPEAHPWHNAQVETFFRDIAPGACRSGGGEAPKNVIKNRISYETRLLSVLPTHKIESDCLIFMVPE
jgi:hypothetical protein